MGKKSSNASNLGRALIKNQKLHKKKKAGNSMLHTSELGDGSDWNRINFASITEETDIDGFLSTAELAGTDFKAQKLNVTFVSPVTEGILSPAEQNKIHRLQNENKSQLRIPRRPMWDRSTSPEELAQLERESFLEWRRSLALLQEKEGILLTPYEKNLEFWRQLWRVIERSDVIVLIVDARNPLLFHCEDLQNYVKEVNDKKKFLLLVNKADFLTDEQREIWSEYFEKEGIDAVFFSAIIEDDILEDIEEDAEDTDDTSHDTTDPNNDNIADFKLAVTECEKDIANLSTRLNDVLGVVSDVPATTSVCQDDLPECTGDVESHIVKCEDSNSPNTIKDSINSDCKLPVTHIHQNNSPNLLSRLELIEFFKRYYASRHLHNTRVTIGLVGYPNVGKSSTINALLSEKKVSVSATPGKTKHFQTIVLSDDMLLCDCPGLVFPAFVSTKAEMIVSGILPIDQMRDHVPPMNVVLSHIPRDALEPLYGLRVPKPLDGEDPNRIPTSEEFLCAYGYKRGFMTPRGIPDHPRSARYILKDYVNGKLLYAHCPPGFVQEEYHTFVVTKVRRTDLEITPQQRRTLYRPADTLDDKFFEKAIHTPHFKGPQLVRSGTNAPAALGDNPKPWRAINKRNTRQKLRNQFAHLDF